MANTRLQERYQKEIVPALIEEFGYTNVMQVPRVTKLTLNMGVGEASQDAKALEEASKQLGAGMPVGLRVTLRGDRMWEMLDRLLSIALPRIRDFRGIPAGGFDGRGNFNLGLREQTIFPEIDYDKIDRVRGLDIAITTSAETDDEGRVLLKKLGMPFRES
jgi:large subunit ribosomal protein L5